MFSDFKLRAAELKSVNPPSSRRFNFIVKLTALLKSGAKAIDKMLMLRYTKTLKWGSEKMSTALNLFRKQ
jgi:hypothetical protein